MIKQQINVLTRAYWKLTKGRNEPIRTEELNTNKNDLQ